MEKRKIIDLSVKFIRLHVRRNLFRPSFRSAGASGADSSAILPISALKIRTEDEANHPIKKPSGASLLQKERNVSDGFFP